MNPSSRLRTRARARSVEDVIGSPFSVTRPRVGTSSSPIRFSSVLLPQPDGPMIEMNSPTPTSRSMSGEGDRLDALGAIHLLDALEADGRVCSGGSNGVRRGRRVAAPTVPVVRGQLR